MPRTRHKKPSRVAAKRNDRLPLARLAELESLLSARKPDSSAEFDFDHALCQTVWPEALKRGLQALSVPRRRYYGCFMLEAEVNNGGFVQFFDNGGPALAKEALAFLEDRGPRPVAALLRRAIKAFPTGRLPRTHKRLEAITLADFKPDGTSGPLGRKLDRITSAFFSGSYAPALIRARLEYVCDHAGHFFA